MHGCMEVSNFLGRSPDIVACHLQEERAAREAAEARAESARAEADTEVASVRESLGAENAQAAAAREALEKDLEELKVALAQARTATDAIRAQLTAEKIQAQQRIASFEKTKQEIEVSGLTAPSLLLLSGTVLLLFCIAMLPTEAWEKLTYKLLVRRASTHMLQARLLWPWQGLATAGPLYLEVSPGCCCDTP